MYFIHENSMFQKAFSSDLDFCYSEATVKKQQGQRRKDKG